MECLKKNDMARKYLAIKRHLILLLKPLVFSSILTLLWYQLWLHGIHFPRRDEAVLTGAIVMTLGVAFSLTAAVVLGAVWNQYRQIVVSVIRRDRDTFLMYRDERIPILLHLLLGAFSVPLVVIIGLLDYANIWSGLCSIFIAAFIISLYWVVATELDNPAKSIWFAGRVPKEWLAIDVDTHFKLTDGETS